jgi:exo-1,4-beta-D-glucosaminidase
MLGPPEHFDTGLKSNSAKLMRNKKVLPVAVVVIMLSAVPGFGTTRHNSTDYTIRLSSNWTLQSSCLVRADGEQISTTGFDTLGWHATAVPSTVVAALVHDKTYLDPYVGMNLRLLPGVGYPVGEMFSNIPMPNSSPFRCSWWFRTEFQLRPSEKKRWLHFDGINYRANIWINGKRIADSTIVAGAFRQFEFEISSLLTAGTRDTLAVEVFPPEPRDLAITFIDWNPMPPDKDMGIWRDVYVTSSGDVSLRHPFVGSKLDSHYASAKLTIQAELHNSSHRPLHGVLRIELNGRRFDKSVDLSPREQKEVEITSEGYPGLTLVHPRLWWPTGMGRPELYHARISFVIGGETSDATTVTFGVREISSRLTEEGYRLFSINGRPTLIKGAGWTSEMLERWSPQRMKSELMYAKDIGLNAVRLEGQIERDEFFDLTDQMGILVIAGWPCCSAWEHWPDWQREQYEIAGASLVDQVRRLRNHPSMLAWLYGSDNPPPNDVERMYLRILGEQRWPNPSLSSASQKPSSVTGNSGVKMLGPYDYVPPNYWLMDKETGGAYGFNMETGPGPAIPPLESLMRFIPPAHLWPIGEDWNYHSGSRRFSTIDHFTEALGKRYGLADDLNDYIRKSQAMAYEGERAMFEAYARNKYHSTGIIQWMLNNAWPSLIWHLYDDYLVPAGGYFGAKKACETLHAQYSYDDHTIVVVNERLSAAPTLTLRARIFDIKSRQLFERKVQIDVPPDAVVNALQLPSEVQGLSTTYFLQLELKNRFGRMVSENFYWLSTDPDQLDWPATIGTAYTPQSAYANLKGLAELPNTRISVKASTQINSHVDTTEVMLRNVGADVAFMIRVRLTDGKGGPDITPIFMQDNYVSLLPGEERKISVKYEFPIRTRMNAILHVSGWNVTPTTISPSVSRSDNKAIP